MVADDRRCAVVPHDGWCAMVADDRRCAVVPHDGWCAVVPHDGWCAVVADDRRCAVVPHDGRCAMVADDRRCAVVPHDGGVRWSRTTDLNPLLWLPPGGRKSLGGPASAAAAIPNATAAASASLIMPVFMAVTPVRVRAREGPLVGGGDPGPVP